MGSSEDAGNALRYSARTGRRNHAVEGLAMDPLKIVRSERLSKEASLEKLRRLHRPTLALIVAIAIWGIFESDFEEYMQNQYAQSPFSFSIQNSSIYRTEIMKCTEYYGKFQYEGLDCGYLGQERTTTVKVPIVPLKWFLLIMALACFLINELFRNKIRTLREAIRPLKRQESVLQRTHRAEFQEVMERFQFGLAKCPDCGRLSRVPPASTIMVTCGSCGSKWLSAPEQA